MCVSGVCSCPLNTLATPIERTTVDNFGCGLTRRRSGGAPRFGRLVAIVVVASTSLDIFAVKATSASVLATTTASSTVSFSSSKASSSGIVLVALTSRTVMEPMVWAAAPMTISSATSCSVFGIGLLNEH